MNWLRCEPVPLALIMWLAQNHWIILSKLCWEDKNKIIKRVSPLMQFVHVFPLLKSFTQFTILQDMYRGTVEMKTDKGMASNWAKLLHSKNIMMMRMIAVHGSAHNKLHQVQCQCNSYRYYYYYHQNVADWLHGYYLNWINKSHFYK